MRPEQVQQRSALPPHATLATGWRTYSMTSSARSTVEVGNVTPIALAVFKLSANSKLIGCSIGRPDGFAPLRIFATYEAARRYVVTGSMPYDMSPPASM